MTKLKAFAAALILGLSVIGAVLPQTSAPAHAVAGALGTPVSVGQFPMDIAISPNNRLVYTANMVAGTVTVFDSANPSVLGTITVGRLPTGLAFTPDGMYLFVANYFDNTVSVIRTLDNAVAYTISVGHGPSSIAVNPSGSRAYVTNYTDGTISVIDLADFRISPTEEINLGSGTGPQGIAISRDGVLMVASWDLNKVFKVDLSLRVRTSVSIGTHPRAIAISPDGVRAYITNYDSASVSVVALSDLANLGTISVGANPSSIAISPDGRTAVVGSEGDNSVRTIGLATGAVNETGRIGQVSGVAITPDGTSAWVLDRTRNSALLLTIATPMVLTFDIPSGNAVSLPLQNFIGTVGWGDGTFSTSVNASNYLDVLLTHTYTATNHSARVTITGIANGFGEVASLWSGYDTVTALTSWGNLGANFASLDHAFLYSRNLTGVPSNLPSSVTSLAFTFQGSGLNDPNVTSWDVSHVEDMTGLFSQTTVFNQNIGGWDVSNVAWLGLMFADATAFNQDISRWSFTTAHDIDMDGMFEGATSFNNNVSSWDVSHVYDFSTMFKNATAFNQDLSSWNVNRARRMGEMFDGSALSAANYSSILHAWAASARSYTLNFGASGIQYSSTVAPDRAALIAKGWTITDGGLAPSQIVTPVAPSASSPSVASAPEAVETSVDALPHTGVDVDQQVSTSVLLLLAGLGLLTLAIARRRRN